MEISSFLMTAMSSTGFGGDIQEIIYNVADFCKSILPGLLIICGCTAAILTAVGSHEARTWTYRVVAIVLGVVALFTYILPWFTEKIAGYSVRM